MIYNHRAKINLYFLITFAMTEKEIINQWIQDCNFYIQQVKSCSEYFGDGYDLEVIDYLKSLRNLFLKLSNQNKNKSWN